MQDEDNQVPVKTVQASPNSPSALPQAQGSSYLTPKPYGSIPISLPNPIEPTIIAPDTIDAPPPNTNNLNSSSGSSNSINSTTASTANMPSAFTPTMPETTAYETATVPLSQPPFVPIDIPKEALSSTLEPESGADHQLNLKRFIVGLATALGILAICLSAYSVINARLETNNLKLSSQDSATSINVNTSSLHLNLDTVVSNGRKLSATGQVLIQNETNSLKALSLQNAAGNSLLIADTKNQKVGIDVTPIPTGADLQVGGDIAAGGSLSASNGTTNLSNAGLVINSVLVCTASGCGGSGSGQGAQGNTGANGTASTVSGKNGTNGTNGTNGVGCSSGSCVQLQSSSPGIADTGNLNISGRAIAGAFQGDGSALSNVNAITLGGNNSAFFTDASNLNTGTLADTRLSTNVTLLGNSFNGANQLVQLNPSGDLPVLSGINLTNLDASNIAAGTVNDLRLSPNVTLQGNTFNGANQLLMATAADFLPALNGSLVTNLDASNITSGSLSDSRLSPNVALLDANQTFGGNNTFSNAIITPSLQSAGPALNIGTSTAILSLQGTLASNFGAVDGSNSVRIGFAGVPSGNITYQFDTATTPGTYTVCTTVGNCAGSGTGATTLGGNTNRLAKFTGTNSIGNASITDDGTSIVIHPNSNSIGTFQVQNVAGTSNLLMADTTNTRIAIAKATANYTLDVGGTVNAPTILQNGNQVCDVSGNCTGGSGQIGGAGTSGTIPVFTASASIGNSLLTQSGSTVTSTGNLNVTGQYQVANVQIASANLSDSANLAKLNGSGPQIFSGNNQFAGILLVQSAIDSTMAFQIQNSTGTSNLFIADTANSRIGIGIIPTYTLDVAGDINVSSGSVYRINGIPLCGATPTCAASSGSASYIQNSVAQQANANFNIRSVSAGSVVGILRGAAGQTADLLHVQDENGANVFSVDSTGEALVRPASNSAGTFQIQNAAGTSNLFIADTANTRVGIGKVPTLGTLDVNGSIYQSGNQVCDTSGNCVGGGGVGSAIGGSGTTNTLALFTSPGTIGNSTLSQSGSTVSGTNLNVTGTYQVNGAQIASTNLSNDANLAKLNVNQSFSGNNTFSSASNSFTGNGAGLTSLNGTSISSGTVADSRLSANVALLNGTGPQTFTGNNKFSGTVLAQNASDSTAAFQVQNAAGTSKLFIADTANTRIGIGAVPANSLLTIGTNTTTATGGIVFGTDTNIYRSATNVLKTDSSLQVANKLGVGYDPSTITGGVAALNGSLGIGTVAPTQLLQLAASGDTAIRFQTQNSVGALTSAGPSSPGTAVDNAADLGSFAWVSPNSVKSRDNTFATANDGTSSGNSHYLEATNFGFSVPSGATINGIVVDIARKASTNGSTDFINDSEVKIVNSAGTIGTVNKAPGFNPPTTNWPTASTYVSYGSSSDLWGQSWAPSDINSSNFGAVLSAFFDDGDNIGMTASVDHIRITVYYTAANGEVNWVTGGDQSDGGKFKISSSTSLGTSDRLTIDSNGNTNINGDLTENGNLNTSGYVSTSSYLQSTGALFAGGDIILSEANPIIQSGSSYVQIPNGLYVSGGVLSVQGRINARGGIFNDNGSTITLGQATAVNGTLTVGGNFVETSPAGNSRLIEAGTGTATGCGNGSVCTGSISFSGYTSAPTVVATLKNADHGGYEYALSVSNITSTGATINVAIANAAFTFNGNVTVTWIAEGH